MDERYCLMEAWLRDGLRLPSHQLAPASSDASFRRYFRATQQDGRTYIIMDAPPTHEDCRPFIKVANAFAKAGLNVPKILAQDLAQGFLLLTDLGAEQYLAVLNDNTVDTLYGDALAALARLQLHSDASLVLPLYDDALLKREMELFREWFLGRHLALAVTDEMMRTLTEAFAKLSSCALEQPTSWVHRDYHSRNLMFTRTDNPGVLDFQDAVVGPVTYDSVSLLRDCYISWPRARVEQWALRHLASVRSVPGLGDVSSREFLRWFDLMGVQRHLKAIGIFARLNYRDHKPGYLKDIPRTLGYVVDVAQRHGELTDFSALLQRHVLPHVAIQSAEQ